MITILDGPIGTELDARGVATTLPLWSASAIDEAPEVISAIHRDYAEAGATVHTANTFRTKRRTVGRRWERLTREAVEIARRSVPSSHRIAGSIAPLEDCYRPDLSPSDPRPEHREFAETLADAGCDILLCETYPHVGEAMVAVEEAARTGIETWLALTAGPNADLMTTEEMALAACDALGRGAEAVLVNCTPAKDSLSFVQALVEACPDTRVGVYANAGKANDLVGWTTDPELGDTRRGAQRYAELAAEWVTAGASLVGGCCGTSPAHVAALSAQVGRTG